MAQTAGKRKGAINDVKIDTYILFRRCNGQHIRRYFYMLHHLRRTSWQKIYWKIKSEGLLIEWRKNQGFIIVNQITIGGAEFVLGVHEKNPNSFVTWKCKGKDDYYWGHYFTNLLAAQKDFCKRALEEIKAIEVMNKPPKANERWGGMIVQSG